MNGNRFWWTVVGLFAFFLVVLAFTGCHRAPPPDYRVGRIEMSYHGLPPYPPNEVEILQAVIATRASALCGADTERFWRLWCASVSWMPGPTFRCETAAPGDTRQFTGCQVVPNVCLYQVAHTKFIEDSALIDEELHYAFQLCKGRSGEGLSGVYDPDYLAEVIATRAQAKQWLGRAP